MWTELIERESGGEATDATGSGGGRTDLGDDSRFLREDLLGDLAAVYLNGFGKFKGYADTVATDGGDSYDSDGVAGVADDDFLTLFPRDDEHATSCRASRPL